MGVRHDNNDCSTWWQYALYAGEDDDEILDALFSTGNNSRIKRENLRQQTNPKLLLEVGKRVLYNRKHVQEANDSSDSSDGTPELERRHFSTQMEVAVSYFYLAHFRLKPDHFNLDEEIKIHLDNCAILESNLSQTSFFSRTMNARFYRALVNIDQRTIFNISNDQFSRFFVESREMLVQFMRESDQAFSSLVSRMLEDRQDLQLEFGQDVEEMLKALHNETKGDDELEQSHVTLGNLLYELHPGYDDEEESEQIEMVEFVSDKKSNLTNHTNQ